MKLKVTVELGKDHSEFDLAVGDGQKNIKWLATVASQRFSARGPRGSLRTREPKMAHPSGSAYMPSGVTTEGTSFFHPDDTIAERMHDGQHVTVTLAPKIPVDDIGHTMLSRWAIIAFANSEAQMKLREAALKEEYAIQAEQKRKREEAAAAQRAAEQKFKAGEFRQVIAVQLHDQDKIGEALMEDWYDMNRKSAIDNWVRSPNEQKRVKEVLAQNYVQMSELFKTYGAAGSAMGTTHEMEFLEFSQFCHDCALWEGIKYGQDLMIAAFQRSHCYAEMSDPREAMNASLDRPGFFNSLIQLAVIKYGGQDEDPGAKSRRKGGKRVNTPSEHVGSVTDQLKALLNDYVLPLVSKRLVGAMIKSAMQSDVVLAMVSRLLTPYLTPFPYNTSFPPLVNLPVLRQPRGTIQGV